MSEVPPGLKLSVLESSQPYAAFVEAMKIFSEDRRDAAPGIHPTAVLGSGIRLGTEISIGPHAVIGNDVTVGDHATIMAGCFIGSDASIGDDALVYPNAVIREGCLVGRRTIIHSGVIIGADGFGYHRQGEKICKIPQIGNVVIGDDVEIGANTTIDRATTGSTRIGSGTKIDNLVMIAHNVQIGANSLFCGQVGVSGSAVIGDGVTLAGQAGVVGHIEVGDRVVVGAQAGVTKSVPPETSVSGYPAMPHLQSRRIFASMRSLPEMVRKVRELSQRIAELEKKQVRGR
jgi:UDP-3-O-[3-hydroxymyristoyl] glucosamine N-acyltransferase